MSKRTAVKIVGLVIYVSALIGMIQLEHHIRYLDSINPYKYYGLEEMFWAFSFVLLLMFGIGWIFAEFGKKTQEDSIEGLKHLMGESYAQRYEYMHASEVIADIFDVPKVLPEIKNISILVCFFISLAIFAFIINACN